MKKLLRIGEFATLCRVSVKTLRYYEAEGLLESRWVDPDSGYRYFDLDQCARLALIGNLRSAGFRIAEIRSIIAAGPELDALRAVVDDQRSRLLAEQQEIVRKIETLDALARSSMEDSDASLSTVRITSVPEQAVYAMAETVPHLGEPVAAMFESAEATVARAGARAPESPFLLFHDPPTSQGPLTVEVCIPVGEGANLPCTTIDACGRACSIVYTGDYAQTPALLDRVTDWAEQAGWTIAGPLREVYHRFGADQDDYRLPATVIAGHRDEFITELLLPVATHGTEEPT